MRRRRYPLAGWACVIAVLLTVGVAQARPLENPGGPKPKNHARLRAAIEATKKVSAQVLEMRGVVGTATGLDPDGEPVIKVFTAEAGITGIPERAEGFPVKVRVTGRYYARTHVPPDTSPAGPWTRPVPIGVSTGHFSITAGTIGLRVKNGTNVFALSNNHVYANTNQASIGDNVLQPGPYDEGVNPTDAIGTLAAFEPIQFCTIFFIWYICDVTNQVDAAIATTTPDRVGVSTPPDGYGVPNTALHDAYGNPAVTGDEMLSLLLGEPVYKYGRTTALTAGTVNAINATVDVCYDELCSLIARFVDQIIVTPGTFSAGGDSGSLIVSQDGNRPVGLLFAGSASDTVANRIDLVLNGLNVAVDDGGGVAPVLDVATQGITVPTSPIVDQPTTVMVTVRNVGNQPAAGFDVVLTDDTQTVEIGRQAVPGLNPGESSTRSFSWTPSVPGPHTLRASHELGDDANPANDMATTTVSVLAEAASGPVLQRWQGWISTDTWTTVTLGYDYGDEMVVVCTPNYDRAGTGPAMARVRNAQGTSFEVGLARPWYGALPGDHWSAYVHCMVVREGIYTEGVHGVTMEAVKVDNVAATDNSGSWSGQPMTYANAYTNPVVVGQVISTSTSIPGEVTAWSVFWARGTGVNQPPSSGALYVGRHTGADPNGRPAETLAYIVIEAGTGTMDGVRYAAGLGPDLVRGISNSPPYTYALNGLSSASTAILGQAGMDGRDGGWPILYGSNPVTANQLSLAIEEDWYWDSERRHTTEQVNYIVLE